MCKKIITSLLILAFINFLYGCYSQEKALPEELVINEEKITKVVYPDGNEVEFDMNGGTYISIESGIVGTSVNGEKVIFTLEHIKEIRLSEAPSVPLSEVGNRKIAEVIIYPDLLYKFNEKGGVYDEAKNSIQGVTVDNLSRSFKPEQIKEIHLEKPIILISADELKENKDKLISSIVLLNSNRIIKFDEKQGRYVENAAFILGTSNSKEKEVIDASEILYVIVERSDATGTVLTSLAVVVGIAMIIGIVAMATKESCPFVYSYDGKKFVFDAEPLGGATTRGLQRSELSKLEKIEENDGKYKIMVRNEVEETQYIDKLSLYIVDHDPAYEIYPDLSCEIHAVKKLEGVLVAEDENGRDLSKFIDKPDNLFWQSKLPIEEPISQSKHRHQLTITFPKPADSKSAKLIINAGTTLWGSNMIREMLLLYGDSVDKWYNSIDTSNIARETMKKFIEREELYLLKLWIKEADGWKMQNIIQGGGPFVTETRSYNLDLSNVNGDSLIIKLNPPYGFWTLDYIAVEYNSHTSPDMSEIEIASATDSYNTDISEILSTVDDNYLIMPLIGDYFIAEFEAPPLEKKLVRTIFLKSTGYYEIHLPKDQPIQSQKLYEIGFIPGKIVEYSNNRYKDWFNNNK